MPLVALHIDPDGQWQVFGRSGQGVLEGTPKLEFGVPFLTSCIPVLTCGKTILVLNKNGCFLANPLDPIRFVSFSGF